MILIYQRPWTLDQFNDLANRIWPDEQKIEISEHHCCDSTGLRNSFYDNYYRSKNTAIEPFFSKDVERDIIHRCRLLRNLDPVEALRMLRSMTNSIVDIVNNFRPKYFLSLMVDSYIIDIIVRICKIHDIKIICLVTSFINGYFRLTKYGENNKIVTPSDELIQLSLRNLLDNKYKPVFVGAHKKNIISKGFREWAKICIRPTWFWVKSKIDKDPLNYHYLTSRIISQKYFSFLPPYYGCVGGEKNWQEITKRDSGVRIFFPLQMSPEATIDYWSDDPLWVHYEDHVKQVILGNSEVTFYVKEHPNVVALRSKNFLKSLSKLKNCFIVPSSENSNTVLENVDGVVVCTGTVGFEAALRGLPVYTDSKPYYELEEGFYPTKDILKAKIFKQRYNNGDANLQSFQYELMAKTLECVIKGKLIVDGTWDRDNPIHIQNNQDVADGIRSYLFN